MGRKRGLCAPVERASICTVETSRARVRQRLEREGWFLARRGRAHDIYRHAEVEGILTLPRHRQLTPAVARSIAKQAGWSEEERR